jgi:hypothetical protein
MSVRNWLAVSVVVNVVFAGCVTYVFLQREPAAAATPLLPKDLRVPAAPEQEKTIALVTLESAARVALPPAQPEFWKAVTEAEEQAYLQKVDAQLDAMRAALIERYGSRAVDDPAFARLFKPLNGHFSYLSSKSQLALAKLQRSRKSSLPASGLPPTSFDPAAAYQREQEFNAALQAVFTKAEYDEYLLRESLAARQLRSSGVATNEQEFRAAFTALQEMEADRSASGYLAGQEKLRGVLGAQRFAQYSATRDPNFSTLENAATKHQLTRQQTLAVYGAIQEAQLELVRGSVERSNGLTRSGPDPQQVFQQRDQKVATLVGDDVGRDLVSAYSNGVVAASLKVMNQAR